MSNLLDPVFLIEIGTVLAIGLCLGSFASALIWRVPQKINWVKKRSSCPSCKHELNFFDLIPVFSWVFSGGKCRHCKSKVSFIYPLLEVVAALLCAGFYLSFGFSLELLCALLAFPFLLALFAIDLRLLILPNTLVLIVGVIGLLRLLGMYTVSPADEWIHLSREYLGGAILFAGLPLILSAVMSKLLKRQSMGMGDIKFFFIAGVWLGMSAMPVFFILSGGIACIHAIIWQLALKRRIFPFGPALILSFYVLLVLGGSFSL